MLISELDLEMTGIYPTILDLTELDLIGIDCTEQFAAIYDGWRIRACLGWVLILIYIAFIVTVVTVIRLADPTWRLEAWFTPR